MQTRAAAAFLALLSLLADLVMQGLTLPLGQRLTWIVFAALAVSICTLAFVTPQSARTAAEGPARHKRDAATLRAALNSLQKEASGPSDARASVALLLFRELKRIPLAALRLLLVILIRIVEWWRRQSSDRQALIIRRLVVSGYLAAGALLILFLGNAVLRPGGNSKSGWSIESLMDWQIDGNPYETKIVTKGRTGTAQVVYTDQDGVRQSIVEDLDLRFMDDSVGHDRWAYVGSNPRSADDGSSGMGEYAVDVFYVRTRFGRAPDFSQVCSSFGCTDLHPVG